MGRCVRSLLQLLPILLAVTAAASATEITILALDSKTGEPLHGKKFCLTFSTDVRQGPLRQCGRTDKHGVATLQLPTPTPEKVWLAPDTNDLVPCYRTNQPIPVTVIETVGYAASGGWNNPSVKYLRSGAKDAKANTWSPHRFRTSNEALGSSAS